MAQTTARAGLGLALVAAAAFGITGSLADSLIQAGWSPAGVVTARVSIAALVLTVPALVSLRGRWALVRRSAGPIAAFGLMAVAACQVFYFEAISRLSVGVALLLEYLGVVLVVGWMWLRHGHRPGRLTVAGAATAIVGLVLVLDLTSSQRLDPLGVLWGLAAAVGLAAFFTISARNDDPLPPIALAWSGMVLGAITLLIVGGVGIVNMQASTADVVFNRHRVSYLVPVLGLALLAGAFAYIASIGAARILGARLASFVGLTEVLFAVAFAWILLGQLPGLMQLVGGLFIVGGVVIVRVDELRSAPVPREAAMTDA